MKLRSVAQWAMRALVFVLPAFSASDALAQGWYNSDWAYRVPISVSNPNGAGLTNFQVQVNLSSTFDFANAQSNGGDVQFTAGDGVTPIPFWIQSWTSGSSAAIWVQVPSIPAAGTTIYLYYGNPSATSASSGDATFLFFDDFSPPNQGPQTYFQLSSPQIIITPTQSWETSAPHTLSVLDFNQGGHTYWGWYGLQDSCPGGVGLAWSQDLANWTKDTSNPLFTNARWPSVVQVGNTLYMAYTYNYCYDSQINLATSTDGINWTTVETLVAADYRGEPRNQNPNLWLNPNDGQYYLYWYNGNDSNDYNIMVRSASSPMGLNSSANESTILSSTVTLAAPNMLYYGGTYFLATEAYDSNMDWIVNVYGSTTSPISGFTLLPGNPVLANSSACLFQFIFGSTLHSYICSDGSSSEGLWVLDHATSSLTAPRPALPNPSKWTVSAGQWQEIQATLPNGATGYVMQGSMSGSPQILPSTFSGTNYVLQADGEQLQGNVWGLGFRTQNAKQFYSVNLYDNHNSTDNLYSYLWNSGSATQLGDAALGNISTNTWYPLEVRANGSGFDMYENNALQFHTSDGTYASGGVALYGENSTVANFADVFVRSYATVDPSSSVGAEQTPPTNNATLASVTLNPTSVTGGTSVAGTVTLAAAAPSGGVQVTLASNNAAASVPANVMVASGSTTAAFTVSTSGVSAQTAVTITASSGNSVQAALTIDPPSVSSVSLNPATVTGGTSSTGTVTLTGPAPSGGIAVTLASSNTSAATVGSSVTVPANSTTTTFPVTTLALSTQATSTITATLGAVSTANITVNPPQASSVSLNPSTVLGGNSSTGTVTLTGPAPSGGISVSLSSSNTAAATVPASVTIASGATSAMFTITTTASGSTATSTITATLGVAKSATLTVTSSATGISSLVLNPTAVVGGSANSASTGTVTLNGAAPSGGVSVTLSSSNTAAATVPASVTVASGATSATFTVTGLAVTAQATSSITATYNGSISATITVNPLTVSSLTLNPTSLTGGSANSTSTGTVTLNGAAPSGGVSVALSSSNTAAATVPASVTVASGATSATFTVTGIAVTAQATSSITAAHNGSISATITVNPLTVSSLTLNPTSLTGGSNSIATVTLNAAAPAAGATVALSSSNTSVATVPPSVSVPANATSAAFTVTSEGVAANSSANITATLNGSASATLTVTAAPPPPAFTPIRVAVGSSTSYTDSMGNVWSADTGYSGGNTYNCGCTVTGTPDPVLYENQRWGVFNYSFTAPAGNYVVTLKWAEEFTAAGEREFNVAINGATVLTNFDIYAAAGGSNIAVDKSFNVTSNGTITINFTQGAEDYPKIDAIQIAQPAGVNVTVNPTTASLLANQTQQFIASVTGTTNTSVTWSLNPAVGTLTQAGLYAAPATIATQQTVTVTATSAANTSQSASATVTLNPPATLSSVTVSPSTVVGGSNSTGTVTLTAPAPTGGAPVTLSSNNSAATVPPNVIVVAGATAATFNITTSTVTASTPVTITANYGANATATLTVTNFNPIRVAAGGSTTYTDSTGNLWSADTAFSGGNAWNCDCAGSITGTPDPTLYAGQRWGVFSYSFSVPAGNHVVTLKFAEELTGAGQREFNVAINGTTVLSNFDIYAAAGGSNIAIDKSFSVTSSGTITIAFTQGAANYPKVDALEIQ